VEEYYFDGKILKCPSCNQYDFESALHDSEGHIHYQKLIKLKQPFFELVRGEIYNCEVEYNDKVEKTNIILLISDSKTNKVFIMFEAIYCYQNHPEIIKSVMTKTFSELWDTTLKNENYTEYDCSIIVGATENNNSIVSYDGWIFKNFERIN
jgi:hypothetical protein